MIAPLCITLFALMAQRCKKECI